jgi:cob(I)alamin adenosyltransferase
LQIGHNELAGDSALIQVYTGRGKGKTTAALGLALRAAGAGLRVYIGQFVKGASYGELNALKQIKNIKIEQLGRKCFIKKRPGQKDIELARVGFKKVKSIISKRIYDMVILDEINIALNLKLLETKDVIAMLQDAPKNVELILTGRNAHPKVLQLADLVSEIKEVKHYYKKGIKARRGIEF